VLQLRRNAMRRKGTVPRELGASEHLQEGVAETFKVVSSTDFAPVQAAGAGVVRGASELRHHPVAYLPSVLHVLSRSTTQHVSFRETCHDFDAPCECTYGAHVYTWHEAYACCTHAPAASHV
jgi:hypothetical protein